MKTYEEVLALIDARAYDGTDLDLSADCAEACGADDPRVPQWARDYLFRHAYKQGHSAGYAEVLNCYHSLCEGLVEGFIADAEARKAGAK